MNQPSSPLHGFRSALLAAWITGLAAGSATAQTTPPDEIIRQISTELLHALKASPRKRVVVLVEEKLLPHVDCQRMTALAVGRSWRQVSPEQKQRLQAEVRTLFLHTYAGAVSQLRDQPVALQPVRARGDDFDVLVRTEFQGRPEPVRIDYRMAKAETGWKIYDVNAQGTWLVEAWRNSFASEIALGGIDGLIAKLAQRNQAATARP